MPELDAELTWTPAQIERPASSTTLETCGWCRYATGDRYRYDAMVIGRCALLPRYGWEVQRDTPCVVRRLGWADREAILVDKRREIARLEADIAAQQATMRALTEVELDPDRPIQPGLRPADHFAEGAAVRVFTQDAAWHAATVVNGYRGGDGMVGFRVTDNPAVTWSAGYQHPSLLLAAEFRYFQANHAAFHDWLTIADRPYNGARVPIAAYLVALATATP